MAQKTRDNLRNIAIVAHVDHGKTTLVDKLLEHSGTIEALGDRALDTDALERERGITILAKNTGIEYQDSHINIVDTPGHSDFGGEVERTLQMVEGFLLLVDAAEGVLPGTRFVLQKALSLGLKPIVMINKIDKPDADIQGTEEAVQDVFLDLATEDEQLDYPVLYGSSKDGYVTRDPQQTTQDTTMLLDDVLHYVPKPVEHSEGLQMLVTSLDYSDYLGTIAVGRIFSGSISPGKQVIRCKDDYVSSSEKITRLYTFSGLQQVEAQEASFGDIVSVAGVDQSVQIGTTLCDVDNPQPLPYVKVEDPTVSMYFSINDSPLNGQEGSFLTARHIRQRLERELRVNLALRMEETESPEVLKVSGRGQLHLSVLIENMRREGFELQVSAPEVIYKEIDGKKHEPMENLVVDVPQEYQGAVMELLGTRKAQMQNMTQMTSERIRMTFIVPSRGLLGFRSQFLSETRGTGIATFSFHGYEPYQGDLVVRQKGALVSMENGQATSYALDTIQDRGVLFIQPGVQIYEGMIIGENSRSDDITVNPCKAKKLTNMRAAGSDELIQITPPREMTLERCMEWVLPDELIEVTPENIRLRKRVLKASERKKQSGKGK